MKKIVRILSVMILCFSIITFCFNAYADEIKPVDGYQQVTNLGGTRNTNTLGQQDGVEVSKTIEETDLENYFDITLKVQTETRVDEILTDQDLAIVVVMDISNTMLTFNMDGTPKAFDPVNIAGSRLAAANEAARQFVEDFATYSTGVSAQRKLGFVVFNKDAHDVFNLQDCTNANKETLKSSITTKTNQIITAIDENGKNYNGSYKRFTNIEAGLKRADEMLDGTSIKNKYIIFISDGYPTTYVKSGTTGYNPYMSAIWNSDFDSSKTYNASGEGIFYNELSNRLCVDGTSYSDEAARRAATIASSIKSSGTKIYTIGIGIDKQNPVKNLIAYLVDVDKEKYNAKGGYELGDDIPSFKNWLKTSIGSNYLVEPSSTEALKQAYADIFAQVKAYIESSSQATWVAEDPMNTSPEVEDIGFVGFYDDNGDLQESLDKESNAATQSDTASFANDKISWDLKKSECEEIVVDNVTYYIYEIKYRIKLENELDDFDPEKIYATNGDTILTYVQRVDGVLSENKYINFPIPNVIGYFGELEFTKKSSQDGALLSGAKFELVHANTCQCLDEKVHASNEDLKFYATSNALGTVSFTNIPSGHKYRLKEIEAPIDFMLSDEVYDIVVSYGEVTGGPKDNIFINNIKTANLEISKLLDGNTNNSDLFDIKLEVWFKDQLLTGTYSYKLNNDTDGKIKINEDNIRLGNNDKLVIYGLPVGSVYKISEITTNGYQVKYQVNSNEISNGSVAFCNSDNGCRLEEGGSNLVKIINYAEFILPATGSSWMLILIIIGTLLLGVPVIYIGYSFYRHGRSVTKLL